MYRGKKVIVIAPCYNEEAKIGLVVSRVLSMNEKIVDEILVVDDGSTDNSVRVAESNGAQVLKLNRVMGVGAAIRAGYDYARVNKYDFIVVIAGNNKDEPNEIPDLLRPLIEGEYDFVQGSRFLKKGNLGAMPLYRRLATRLHPLLFSLCAGKKVTESTNGFRAFRAQLLENPKLNLNQEWLNHYELEPYFYLKVLKLGYKTLEVPCTKIYPPKKIGYTKMRPFIDWWSILRPLFYMRFGIRN